MNRALENVSEQRTPKQSRADILVRYAPMYSLVRAFRAKHINLKSTLAVATFYSLVAGCTVGPNYYTPEVSVPNAYSEPTTRPTTQPINLSQWWTRFNDPVLDSLIAEAVRSNHDLRIAAARVREARAQRKVTSADQYPAVNTSGLYRRTRQSDNSSGFGGGSFGGGSGFSADENLYQVGFDAGWELDLFGGIRRAVEAADADIAGFEENRRDVLVSLLAEVARNYVELRGFQRQLAIARANIASEQDTVDLTDSRYRAGLTGELDLKRAQALVAGTQAQVPALESLIHQAIHRLSVLEGRPPGTLLDQLLNASTIPKSSPEIPAGVPSDLLRRRPDIRRAERELAAATARIGIATADLFPKFSLTGSLGLQSSEPKDLLNYGSRFWSFGPTVKWPVFDAGKIRANIQVQNERESQALARYEKAVLTALEETENALVNYSREQLRRESLSTAAAANRRAVELANELYSKGLADFLNVLEAQRALYLSEDQLVQSERVVSANLVAVYKALGGGWEGDTP
jgi:NodT family efflux transporter outer membrane factor (OMF) lipoprotein